MGKMFLRDPLTYPSEKLKYLKKKKQQSVLDDIRNVNKISVYNYTSLEKSRGSDDLLNSLHASFDSTWNELIPKIERLSNDT